ncbi:Kir protein [Plasmodium coatneyi]|uniref:Kir protein n=1 Tax=Plasmodium coatneyi TaxID=208452 RepID=A0A1B1E2Z2_9APIC|nr:Kir protein [Plasmodium coatneyi]ANQ09378.1 Kir protein [Plasmodium coatneyi]
MAPKDGPSIALPSEEMYDALEKGRKCHSGTEGQSKYTQVKTEVEGLLEVHTDITERVNVASKIVKNYCDACMATNTRKRGHYFEPCYLFYYWLSKEMKSRKNTSSDFYEVMEKIYQKLKDFPCNNRCSTIYRPRSNTHFDESKTLFDFGYNYESLQLRKRPATNGNLCWPQYKEHRDAAKTAHEQMVGICGGDETKCPQFMSAYKQYFQNGQQEPPPLKCNSTNEVQAETESEGTHTSSSSEVKEDSEDDENEDDLLEEGEVEEEGVLGVEELKNLPSYAQYYEKFEQGWNNCNDNGSGWPNQTEVKLVGGNANIQEDDAKKIVGALCYVDSMKSVPEANNKYCDFLYFWVGDMLWKKFTDGGSFLQAMKAVKKAMKDSYNYHKCSFKFSSKRSKFFKYSKYLSDYYENRDFIGTKLKSGEEHCGNAYYEYLLRAQLAYDYVKNKCPNGNENGWCKEFEKMYGECKNQGSTAPQCKVTHEPEHSCRSRFKPGAGKSAFHTAEGISPVETYHGSNSTITAVASSALAVLGTAFITLFLYRVNAVTVEILVREFINIFLVLKNEK